MKIIYNGEMIDISLNKDTTQSLHGKFSVTTITQSFCGVRSIAFFYNERLDKRVVYLAKESRLYNDLLEVDSFREVSISDEI